MGPITLFKHPAVILSDTWVKINYFGSYCKAVIVRSRYTFWADTDITLLQLLYIGLIIEI